MLEVSVHGRERGRVGGSIESGLSDVRLSDEGVASLPTKDDSKGEGQRNRVDRCSAMVGEVLQKRRDEQSWAERMMTAAKEGRGRNERDVAKKWN